MTMRLALIFAAAALAPGNGLAQNQAAAQKDAQESQLPPPPETKALVESCSAHKFETTVEMSVDGKKRNSRVKLCGKEGQTDADWASTLKDAVTKIEAEETMAQAAKDQIIAALNAEISKLEVANAAGSAPPVATAPSAAPPPESATLPPLPTAPALATNPPLAAPAASPGKPSLTIHCSTLDEPGGGGPCISLDRETLLTIRADEELPGGTRLRFLRRGDVRGEVTLAQMRQGQSLRFKLPPKLCVGVASSKVEIQILGRAASGSGANQILDSLGPYRLRC